MNLGWHGGWRYRIYWSFTAAILLVVILTSLTCLVSCGSKQADDSFSAQKNPTKNRQGFELGSDMEYSSVRRDVKHISEADKKLFLAYLREHGKEPIQYVLSKLRNHDIVILGEQHEVRETCGFIDRKSVV